jgi:hypothetical protein
MPDHAREDLAIEAFCRILTLTEDGPVSVVERPDREPQRGGGCEAIIQRQGKRQAVEHTTFDILLNKRLDDARLRVLDPAAIAIAKAFPDCRITIGVPLGAVQSGRDWSLLCEAFQEAVVDALLGLPADSHHTNLTIPGLFPVTIFRRRPTRLPGCFIARKVSDEDMEGCSVNLISALQAKERQLRPYAIAGLTTVLLLDNDDLSLMDAHTAAWQFQVAHGQNPVSIDEVYLLDGTERPPWVYPIKLGDRMHPLPEFQEFFERQCHLYYPELK